MCDVVALAQTHRDYNSIRNASRQMAEGEKQEAGGGRQEADSRKQTHYCLLAPRYSVPPRDHIFYSLLSTHYCLLATRYSVPPRDDIFYSLLSFTPWL